MTIDNLEPAVAHAMLIAKDGTVLESSVDIIEETLARQLWEKNKEFMEDISA